MTKRTDGRNVGKRHYNWKGGRKKMAGGYTGIWVAPNKYKLEHRLVMEQHLGRELQPGETVHHINGVKTDNGIENLELWTGNHPQGVRVSDIAAWRNGISSGPSPGVSGSIPDAATLYEDFFIGGFYG